MLRFLCVIIAQLHMGKIWPFIKSSTQLLCRLLLFARTVKCRMGCKGILILKCTGQNILLLALLIPVCILDHCV